MSGLALVTGADRSAHHVLVQVPGTGHHLGAEVLREAMTAEPAIRERFGRFAQALAVQATHTALANKRHVTQDRLVRWLLMCHDRVEGDGLELTHEFLGLLLGLRRAGVGAMVPDLEKRGVIRATSGRILDRGALEALAHGTYGEPEAEYARLMG
jgi:CRP-like cAMP-binding protein